MSLRPPAAPGAPRPGLLARLGGWGEHPTLFGRRAGGGCGRRHAACCRRWRRRAAVPRVSAVLVDADGRLVGEWAGHAQGLALSVVPRSLPADAHSAAATSSLCPFLTAGPCCQQSTACFAHAGGSPVRLYELSSGAQSQRVVAEALVHAPVEQVGAPPSLLLFLPVSIFR